MKDEERVRVKINIKKVLIGILLVVAVISGYSYFTRGGASGLPLGNKKTASPDDNWREAQRPYANNVVCTLKISAFTNFEKNILNGEVNVDKKPTTLTFVDINTDAPSVVGNLGDKAPLSKIDNGTEVYLIEKTDFGNINIFTLFRNKNIMTMSKQYNLLGMPFGMIMMGDCLSGA